MKRYALFCGADYYPSGGWQDYRGSFDTKEEALDIAIERKDGWFEIVDLTTGEVVKTGNRL